MTQRDGMGSEVGGGFRMGNTCTPMADSCWCMAKPIQYCKVISLQLNKFILKKKRTFQYWKYVKCDSKFNYLDLWLIPGLGRSPGEGNGIPLQYSCLENPMDRGAWRATVQGVAKSRTRLSDWAHTDFCYSLAMWYCNCVLCFRFDLHHTTASLLGAFLQP